MLASIARLAPGAVLVATRSTSERAMDPERIVEAGLAWGLAARAAGDVATACRTALALVGTDQRVLHTGSLFAVGEAMRAYGGAPGEAL
jgi:folylpolyglutamate synthase/dihydropteroate synthase